ncbi:MAG TPA: type II toxin-antitoxin system RelE/ParE family toxin, partial [Clostridiales bacterium]|nr:type II toxin-antitoxin system RelE/ParE family toxin [Clostridiales bacterium]
TFPFSISIASSVIVKQDNIRKLIINNYIVFYKIKEEYKEVYILRIMYSGSDWIEKL